ncbi:uncharacterized protein [Dermacentor andersoni]|uniref:uncharacterized protein isoform X2 n=1 Tax=Dermacentor andersoni TaxID=34620 RepID=UPI002155BAB4|nr:uncharacterized protein LOC126523563 isoform X2 [Dermacentor andersoni]
MSDATGRNASSAAAVKRAARAEAQRRRRQNPEVRAAEAEAKRRRRAAMRAAEAEAYRRRSQEDPAFRAAKAEAQRRRRQNPEVRAAEAEAKRRRRDDPEVRAAEAEAYRRRRQENPAVRVAKTEAQRRRRQNPKVRAAEAEARRKTRLAKRQGATKTFKRRFRGNRFMTGCSACGGLWLRNDLKPLPDSCLETLQQAFPNLDLCQFRLCSTCMQSVRKGDIPSSSHNQRLQISPKANAPPATQCEASPGELGRKDKSEQRQSLGQWVVTEDCSWRKTQATQCKSYVDQVRTLGSQAETGHVMAETSAQTAMVFPCTIPAQTRPTHLQQKKLLATVSTNPKMPLPRLKPGGMPGNLLATAAAPVMKKQTAELPNFKAIVCLSNSKSPQGEPMCAIGGGNLHPSILPIVPPIMSATPCNFKTKLSQSELLSLSTDASSRLHNLPSGPAIVFSSPNHTGTGIARQTKLLCSPSGASSRDIQLSSAPVALPNTPLSSEISQPLVLCFSQDSSSSNAHQPLSEPKVVQATLHHAETQLSQSRLLCLSSNSLLPNMPTLPLTTLCRAEAPHLATAENCVTLITVPVMQVCTTESPSFACSQENAHTSLNDHLEPHSSSADTQLEQERHRKATLCNSCVDQVRTLGSQTETGHVMVETSTQTAMVLPRTIPVQTRPTKLRSQGTNTVPE